MRTKRSIKNLLFNVFQQAIGILTSFLLPPMLITYYGSAINGLISTIKQIVSYAQTTGAGIASASTFVMYKPLAEKDYKTLSGIFSATKKMFIKAGNLATYLVLAAAIIYPVFVSDDVNSFITIVLILILGACGVSEFYLIGKYQALFTADQKNYVVAIAQGVGNIFNIVISIILIRLKLNIILVQMGAMIVYILRVIILTLYFKKNYKMINLKAAPMMNKISQRKDAVIHEISALIVNNSSLVIVSLFLGLKEASVYSVYMLIFSGLNILCSIISNGLYASFGDVIAKKETSVLNNAYNIFEWGYFIVIFIVYTVTYLLLIPFITVYTKNINDINYILPVFGALYTLVGLINNIKIPARTIAIAGGHFKDTKKYSMIEMLINVISQLILVNFLGIYGVVLGCLFSCVYRCINYIWFTNTKILIVNSRKTYIRLMTNILLSVILIITIKDFIPKNITNYFSWGLTGIIVTFVVFLIIFITNTLIDKKTFKEAIKNIKIILKNS